MHSERFTLRADHVLALDSAAPPSQIGNIDAALDCLDESCKGTGPSCDTAAIASYATNRAHPFLPAGAPYWSRLATVSSGQLVVSAAGAALWAIGSMPAFAAFSLQSRAALACPTPVLWCPCCLALGCPPVGLAACYNPGCLPERHGPQQSGLRHPQVHRSRQHAAAARSTKPATSPSTATSKHSAAVVVYVGAIA